MLYHLPRSTVPEGALVYAACLVAVSVVINIARSRYLMTGSADRNGSSWRRSSWRRSSWRRSSWRRSSWRRSSWRNRRCAVLFDRHW